MKQDKVEIMLALIKQRLSAYTVEETIDRLHTYGCEGPTISEFLESLSCAHTVEAEVGVDQEIKLLQSASYDPSKIYLIGFAGGDLVIANDEFYDEQYDNCSGYSLAA